MARVKIPAERKYVNAHHDGADITLLFRDESGELCEETRSAEWIAYFPITELGRDAKNWISDHRYVRSSHEEGDWLRVGFKDRWLRNKFCFGAESVCGLNDFHHREADLDPIRRYLSDSGVVIARPRSVYLDIETDPRKGIIAAKQGKVRWLCWTLVDDAGHIVMHAMLEEDTDEAETRLIRDLWRELEAFDCVIAWGGGDTKRKGKKNKFRKQRNDPNKKQEEDGFDFPSLFNRSEALGIEFDRRRWNWLDHLEVYARMNKNSAESGDEKQSMKLQAIAFAELGEGKTEFDARKCWEFWEAGGAKRRELARYNIQDTELLFKIEKKTGYISIFFTICEVCRLFPETSSLQPTRQMDGFMLRLGVEHQSHFSTKRYGRDDEEADDEPKFEGALVLEPKTHGIERDIHVIDFSSMYPSVMISWNMSQDTKVEDAPRQGPIPPNMCRAPGTGVCFRTDKQGILVVALLELIRLRKEWESKAAQLPPGTPEWHECKRRSMVYKVVANSFYGASGSPFSRFFDQEIAESVTLTGQWLIKKTNLVAESDPWNFPVVYGDTDGSFFRGGPGKDPRFVELVDHLNKEIYPAIVKRQGCQTNYIKVAYEKSFDRIVIVTAKRYIGRYSFYKDAMAAADSKPEIKGLEYKRGDASLLGRLLQAETIDMLVGGLKISKLSVPTINLEDYHHILSTMRQHVLKDELPYEEIVMVKGLGKDLDDYAQKKKIDGTDAAQAPQVVVGKMLRQRGQEIAEGMRIEYIVNDGSVSPMKVIPGEDYDGSNVDRFYCWETMVFPPTMRLLQAAFPDHDWTAWHKVRPKKPRKKKETTPVLPGQLKLPETHADLRPICSANYSTEFFVFHVDEKACTSIGEVKDVLRAHPGDAPAILILRTMAGDEAELVLNIKVDAHSKELRKELDRFQTDTRAA